MLVYSNIIFAQKITPKKINDPLPEVQFKNVYGKSTTTISLAAFKGKMILIDFWATWCVPCVSSMRHLDSLQTQFGDRLQIICITREDEKTVKEAYKHLFPDKAPAFITILKDTLLEKYMPHVSIPHCVWADKDGIVKAITDKSSVDEDNIRSMLTGQFGQIKNKPSVIKLASHKPPYASKQITYQDEFLYHSQITKYREDLPITFSRGLKNEYITCINVPIIRLYQSAFGKFDLSWLDMNRVICRGFKTFADSAAIGLFKSDKLFYSWKSNIKNYAFSYELAVSDAVYSKDELFEIMQQDLNRYFAIYGLHVSKENGSQKVLALVNLKEGKFVSYKDSSLRYEKYSDSHNLKIANKPMTYFLSQLCPYLNNEIPLINQTRYEGNINISLFFESSTILDLNRSLAKYGLKIVDNEVPMELLVITKTEGKKQMPEAIR